MHFHLSPGCPQGDLPSRVQAGGAQVTGPILRALESQQCLFVLRICHLPGGMLMGPRVEGDGRGRGWLQPEPTLRSPLEWTHPCVSASPSNRHLNQLQETEICPPLFLDAPPLPLFNLGLSLSPGTACNSPQEIFSKAEKLKMTWMPNNRKLVKITPLSLGWSLDSQ